MGSTVPFRCRAAPHRHDCTMPFMWLPQASLPQQRTATTSAKRCTGAVRDWAASTSRTMSATAASQVQAAQTAVTAGGRVQRPGVAAQQVSASATVAAPAFFEKHPFLPLLCIPSSRHATPARLTSVAAAVHRLHGDLAIIVDSACGHLVPCKRKHATAQAYTHLLVPAAIQQLGTAPVAAAWPTPGRGCSCVPAVSCSMRATNEQVCLERIKPPNQGPLTLCLGHRQRLAGEG